jgi:hypothetical protein
MTKDIIPTKDPEFDIFQDEVVSKMGASKAAWGIPDEVVTDLNKKSNSWQNAWDKAKEKGNRSSGDVMAKDQARLVLEDTLRLALQRWIQLNELVPDDDKIRMGIKPHQKGKTKTPVPTTIPQIDLKPGNGNTVRIFFKQGVDEAGVSDRGKPEGVDRCGIVYKIGDPSPVSPNECPIAVDNGRSPISVIFQPTDAGKRVYVFAHWINTTNQLGPWTPTPINMIVPG